MPRNRPGHGAERKVPRTYRLNPSTVAAAQRILGTPNATATVDAALDLVIIATGARRRYAGHARGGSAHNAASRTVSVNAAGAVALGSPTGTGRRLGRAQCEDRQLRRAAEAGRERHGPDTP